MTALCFEVAPPPSLTALLFYTPATLAAFDHFLAGTAPAARRQKEGGREGGGQVQPQTLPAARYSAPEELGEDSGSPGHSWQGGCNGALQSNSGISAVCSDEG